MPNSYRSHAQLLLWPDYQLELLYFHDIKLIIYFPATFIFPPFLFLLFSHPVVVNSLQTHRLQHPRIPCPSPPPGVCPSSCSLHWWWLPSSHLILWHPLLILPSIFSSIKNCTNESSDLIRWPKYWRFSVSPSREYSGLSSLKIDCFDLLAVQETLLELQFKGINLWCSAFFMVQLSQPYVTTGKIIVLTIQTFVSRLLSAFQHTV